MDVDELSPEFLAWCADRGYDPMTIAGHVAAGQVVGGYGPPANWTVLTTATRRVRQMMNPSKHTQVRRPQNRGAVRRPAGTKATRRPSSAAKSGDSDLPGDESQQPLAAEGAGVGDSGDRWARVTVEEIIAGAHRVLDGHSYDGADHWFDRVDLLMSVLGAITAAATVEPVSE